MCMYQCVFTDKTKYTTVQREILVFQSGIKFTLFNAGPPSKACPACSQGCIFDIYPHRSVRLKFLREEKSLKTFKAKIGAQV